MIALFAFITSRVETGLKIWKAKCIRLSKSVNSSIAAIFEKQRFADSMLALISSLDCFSYNKALFSLVSNYRYLHESCVNRLLSYPYCGFHCFLYDLQGSLWTTGRCFFLKIFLHQRGAGREQDLPHLNCHVFHLSNEEYFFLMIGAFVIFVKNPDKCNHYLVSRMYRVSKIICRPEMPITFEGLNVYKSFIAHFKDEGHNFYSD